MQSAGREHGSAITGWSAKPPILGERCIIIILALCTSIQCVQNAGWMEVLSLRTVLCTEAADIATAITGDLPVFKGDSSW